MNARQIITEPRQRLAYRVMLYAVLSAGILQWTFIDDLPSGSGKFYVDAVIAVGAVMLIFPLPGGLKTIISGNGR